MALLELDWICPIAIGGFLELYQDFVGAGLRHRDIHHPDAFRGITFDQCAHGSVPYYAQFPPDACEAIDGEIDIRSRVRRR